MNLVRTSTARALTLIELLASLAIIAAIVVVLSVSVRGSVNAAEWHRAIGDVRHLDTMARIRARTDGPMLIALGSQGSAIHATRQSDGSALISVEMPESITLSVLTVDQAQSLMVDGSGRSVDATYLLTGSSRAVRLAVNGLTGQHAARIEASP